MRRIGFIPVAFICIMTLASTSFAASQDKVECRVEIDRSVLPAGGPQEVILKVTLDAPTVPAKTKRAKANIVLVLDRSGSMNGSKLAMAKEAAIEALSRLGADDVFSLVAYDSSVNTLVSAQKVKDIKPIIRVIKQIRTGGKTALFGGVSQGAAEIRKNIDSDYINRVVLLSDGIANIGPSMPDDLGNLGAGLFKEGISVSTVGVGSDYNEDLMAKLSQKSDGNTYFAESGVDLPAIFSEELGQVLNVVAQQVAVTITLPARVEALDIIGREGRIKGNQIELAMNQLYGGQEKFALVKVRVPKSAAGQSMQVAQAEVNYYDPTAMKEQRSTSAATAKFSSDEAEVTSSTNKEVVRDYQLNLNALAQEKAIELSDKGETKAAADQLLQSAMELKSLGSRYQDAEMIQQAAETKAQAELLEDQGMSKVSRKKMRAESYQTKNQQLKK